MVVRGGRLDAGLARRPGAGPHEDLEIAVPAGQFPAIHRALAGFDLEAIGSGRRWPLDSPAFPLTYQTWVRDRAMGSYRLDIFREPHDGVPLILSTLRPGSVCK